MWDEFYGLIRFQLENRFGQDWRARKQYCGSKDKSIVGKTLKAGKYTVMAGLNGKKSAKITLTLKYK